MTASAATAVFGVAELLEIILLDVDNRTLLISQRTCKSFKVGIGNSAKLRCKLFLHHEASGLGESEVIIPRQHHLRPCGELDNPVLGALALADLTDPRCPSFHISRDGIYYDDYFLTSKPAAYDISVNFTGQIDSNRGGEDSWRAMYPFPRGGYIKQFYIDFSGEQVGWFGVDRVSQKKQQLEIGLTLGEAFEMCLAHAQKLVDFEKVLTEEGIERWIACEKGD